MTKPITCARSMLDLPDHRPTLGQALAQTELRNTVVHAISKLRHKLRALVVLCEVHSLTSAEIARHVGLTVAAVKGRTFHAKRQYYSNVGGRSHRAVVFGFPTKVEF